MNTRSREGGIEAVKVLPLPFWTIVLDDLFRAEVTGSMRCSEQTRKEKKKHHYHHNMLHF